MATHSLVFLLVVANAIIAVHARDSNDIHPGWFDRPTCMAGIIELQEQGNFTKNNATYFRQESDGLLFNGPDNMTVTLDGCNEFCGRGTFYWDAGPRLTTWIIPVILLLSNIELSPIDKKRFMTVIHAAGDPIDSFWSLLHKIYIWRRLYEIGLDKSPPRSLRGMAKGERARIIATVLSGFEEIAGAKIESEIYYHMITRQLGRIGDENEDEETFEEWRRAARVLADARTNEFLRTCFAIFVYIFGVISALVKEVGGGNTTPPGGRIGSAIFLSWLVPLALLSNTVGTFTSRRTCLTIMKSFISRANRDAVAVRRQGEDIPNNQIIAQPGPAQPGRAQLDPPQLDPLQIEPFHLNPAQLGPVYQQNQNMANPQDGIELAGLLANNGGPNARWHGEFAPAPSDDDDEGEEGDVIPLIRKSTWNDYFASLQWLGSIYTYRPWKVLYLDVNKRTHAHSVNVLMAFGGVFPVAVSMGGAFAILWYAVPEGLSCRHVWVIGVFVLWIFSALFTSMVYIWFKDRLNRHSLWLIVLIKDSIIGFIGLIIIFLSTAGLFNNCWCWSAYIVRGHNAYVPLNTDDQYNLNAAKIYSIIVSLCIGLQLLFFGGLMYWWRQGLELVRWTETRRRKEWRHETDEEVKYNNENFLLFWYKETQLSMEETRRRQRAATWRLSQTPMRRSLWSRLLRRQ
jgi:hypothetical protein